VTRDAWIAAGARLVVYGGALVVGGFVSRIPTPDGQSLALGAVFITAAAFMVSHSHNERRRNRDRR
jgi:hypothetical protein